MSTTTILADFPPPYEENPAAFMHYASQPSHYLRAVNEGGTFINLHLYPHAFIVPLVDFHSISVKAENSHSIPPHQIAKIGSSKVIVSKVAC